MANLLPFVYSWRMKAPGYPNVTAYQDRHGKWRWRFRKKGSASHTFRSEIGTPAFADEYRLVSGKTPKRQPARPDLTGTSFVYFIGASSGPVKIGVTRDIHARLKKLQTAYPKRLQVLALIKGGKELEAMIHQRFADRRRFGEWFARNPEMTALIAENRHHRWRTYGAEGWLTDQNAA